MGCGASKRGKDEIIPLKAMAENCQQPQNLKDSPSAKNKDKKSKNNSPIKHTGEELEDDIYTNTAVNRPQNRLNKEFLELSNFSDMPEYQQDHPNFNQGELSPIDLNKSTQKKKQKKNPDSQHFSAFDQENIGAKTFSQAQQGQKAKKVVRVKVKRDNALSWPDSGRVEIKTISYKVVYNHEAKGFRVVKSKDHYLTSLLTWYKDEEEDIFEFNIKDTAYINLRTGNSQEVATPQINFQVDYDGKFLGIKNLEGFVDSVLNLQSSGKVTKNRHVLLQRAITKELERTWNLMVQEWIPANRAGKGEFIMDKRQQFDKDCVLLNRTKVSSDEEYRKKLRDKLADPSTFYKILSSSKMVKDRFKKWELHKDSAPRQKSMYLEDGPNSHRSLKLNFIATDTNEVFTTINDAASARPFMSSYENSKNIVFEVNKDIYIDVGYEAKMSMFLWNDIKGHCNDDFLISEMVKFQDSCDAALGDLLAEISTIQKIPLKFRIESNKEEKENMNMKEAFPDTMSFNQMR